MERVPDNNCSDGDCCRPAHARGMCSTHYKHWYVAQTGYAEKVRKNRDRRTYNFQCEFCGHDAESPDVRQRYCSTRCASWSNAGYSRSRVVVLRVQPPRTAPLVATRRRRGRWFGCTCAVCGSQFVAAGFHATCSAGCRKARATEQRRVYALAARRKRGRLAIEPSDRLAIYERDRWMCQICGEPTSMAYSSKDPLSPTLDHIVPQSLQLIPDHSPSNLRLAHAICNSVRGNRLDEGVLSVS